ncbi:tripartite tricarboxylate transporter TctB family protein [Pseudomonas sp. zfem001]|uniref:tripartite tricarboxylate transporter TctB family protein n=1 Tax=Pseudomonas sp. zfem001 TaxID=3078196 RepID=UPI0029293EC2|nr:tripartite tricarboxylate transporter TctB family protein [Pseudomonas sp. zfem001]MDU9406489.1 tripartite tricarboxylate transporter TctB family protein [Pseudomonas sp. zfem001]
MNTLNKKELIIGIAMLGASLTYLVLAQQLPGHDGVDAATVPKLLAGFLSLLGVMQLVSAFAKPKAAAEPAASPAPAEAEEPTVEIVEPKTVIKTLGLILGYMALLGPVGFPIMTVVYLYLQFLVLTPVNQKARHLTYLLVAVICSALIFLLFREAFDLLLPAGLLNNYI